MGAQFLGQRHLYKKAGVISLRRGTEAVIYDTKVCYELIISYNKRFEEKKVAPGNSNEL